MILKLLFLAVHPRLWRAAPVFAARSASRRRSADPRLGGREPCRLGTRDLLASGNLGQQRGHCAELGVAGRPGPVRSQRAVPAGWLGANEAGDRKPCRSADGDLDRRYRCHGAGHPISDRRLGRNHRQLYARRSGKDSGRDRHPMKEAAASEGSVVITQRLLRQTAFIHRLRSGCRMRVVADGSGSPGKMTLAVSLACGKSFGFNVTMKSARPCSAHSQKGESPGSG